MGGRGGPPAGRHGSQWASRGPWRPGREGEKQSGSTHGPQFTAALRRHSEVYLAHSTQRFYAGNRPHKTSRDCDQGDTKSGALVLRSTRTSPGRPPRPRPYTSSSRFKSASRLLFRSCTPLGSAAPHAMPFTIISRYDDLTRPHVRLAIHN